MKKITTLSGKSYNVSTRGAKNAVKIANSLNVTIFITDIKF